jgi:hypothetical protein
LKVDHQIELFGAQAAPHRGQRRHAVPTTRRAIEGNDLVEVRLTGEQAGQRAVHHPGQMSLRPALAKHRGNRQRLDNVPQGAGLDQADALGVKL